MGLRVDSTSVLSEASTANNNSVMADIQVTTMSAQPDLTVAILSLSDTTFQIDGGSTSQPPESGTIEFEEFAVLLRAIDPKRIHAKRVEEVTGRAILAQFWRNSGAILSRAYHLYR